MKKWTMTTWLGLTLIVAPVLLLGATILLWVDVRFARPSRGLLTIVVALVFYAIYKAITDGGR